MKQYRTTLRIIVPIEVEAASMDEAHRIIDGIIEAEVNQLTVYEGTKEDPDDELSGFCERIERDEITRVPE
jgi:hypothetical protein